MPTSHKPDHPKQPWPVSDQVRQINITGYLIPWMGDQAVYVQLRDCPDIFLAVFSTVKKLRRYLTIAGIPYERIKKIEDHHEFLSSLPYRLPDGTRLRIIIDPWVNEVRNTRFTEILRSDA